VGTWGKREDALFSLLLIAAGLVAVAGSKSQTMTRMSFAALLGFW
jgi:hypothetical protein